jgi:catechol 2,3-dioxygenase-like lactoylglutathione lyase family enzyme
MLPLLLFLAADLPVSGISHVGFRVADLEKTRAFYSSALGIEQAFDQKDASGKTTLAVLQIDKDQFLEFSPGAPAGFTHIAFLTDKLENVRALVEKFDPPELRTGRDRTRNFSIKDPDGHRIEFVRYEADSLQAAAHAKFAGNSHGAIHLKKVGIAVADRERANKFFHDALGVDRYIELLTPGAAIRLYFEIPDTTKASAISDPDGTPIELVRQSQ